DVDVLVENLHVAIGFDHAGGDHTRLVSLQRNGLRIIAIQFEWNLLEIQDDVGGVFDDARNRLKLVENALDANRGDGRAFDGRAQNAAERVSNSGSETTLERLRIEFAILVGYCVVVTCRALRFLKSLRYYG